MTLFQSQLRPRLLLLLLASGSVHLFAGSARPQDLSHWLSSPTVTGWALADFDGDETLDLATTSSARHDARGYSQDVLVSFGSYQHSSFRFRSRSATVDLSTSDIDGDQDPDLVVREPLSMTPIGVWLNDGAGSFHEGNLADFPELNPQRGAATWQLQRQRISLVGVFEERTQAAMPGTAVVLPRFMGAHLLRPDNLSWRPRRSSDFRDRAPPHNC